MRIFKIYLLGRRKRGGGGGLKRVFRPKGSKSFFKLLIHTVEVQTFISHSQYYKG